MSCQSNTHNSQSYFAELLNEINPKSRYISQMHAEQYPDTIYLEIINGDIEIAKQKTPFNSVKQQKQDFNSVMKMKLINQAERQKLSLQQKLQYLNDSISALNRYDQLSSRKNSGNARLSYSVGGYREKEEWRKDIQERDKQIKRKKQAIEQLKAKKEQEIKELQERARLEQSQVKKKQILDHVKSIEERSKKREQQIKASNQRYKQLKKQKSLHQKLSQSYNQKQLSFLEQRKKKLAQIRNIHKPLDQMELKEHEQRFLQQKKQKEELRQREKRMNQSRSQSYQPFYKSAFYQKVIEESRNQPENVEQTKVQKIKQYAQKIKEQFVPEVDEKKKQEIQQFLEKQRRKIQQKSEKEKYLKQRHKQKGIGYLQQVRKLPKKRKNSLQPQQQKSQRKQYPNYLVHTSRTQRQRQPQKPWTQILHSSNDKQDKALLLQLQSQKHELQLKRKEQQVRLMKKGDSSDIDQGYFQMIKAKLELLQEN